MPVTERKHFTWEEKEEILKCTGGRCGHCGISLDAHTMTVDHIFPIHKGGTNERNNVIALCGGCNNTKSNFVYGVFNYYPYLLPEYYSLYLDPEKGAAREYMDRSVLGCDAYQYVMIPEKHKRILYTMGKRGAKRERIEQTKKQLSVPVIMERAYAGDAEEIFALLKSCTKKQLMRMGGTVYTNPYVIINNIYDGEVYVLRLNKEICAVFAFCRITEGDIPHVDEIQKIMDNTCLSVKYIMVCAAARKIITQELYSEIMEDMWFGMISSGAVPLYFGMLRSLFYMPEKCGSVPYSICDMDGNLEFFMLDYLRERTEEHARTVCASIARGISEDGVQLLAQLFLKAKDFDHAVSFPGAPQLFEKYPGLKRAFK